MTLQNQRRSEIKSLKIDIKKLKEEIEKSPVVTPDLNEDLKYIMSNANADVSPFMKYFWEEQQKYILSSPAFVSLSAKSARAYEDIRYNPKTGTGFLVLPSQRSLRDYKKYIHPQRGFNPNIINELKHEVEKFSDVEKIYSVVIDTYISYQILHI